MKIEVEAIRRGLEEPEAMLTVSISMHCRWIRSHLVYRGYSQHWQSGVCEQAEAACFDEQSFRHDSYGSLLAEWQVPCLRGGR